MKNNEVVQMFPKEPVPQPQPTRTGLYKTNLQKMYGAFGKKDGEKCGNCSYLDTKFMHNKKYFKCRIVGDTNGPATDWRKKWQACGKFIHVDDQF